MRPFVFRGPNTFYFKRKRWPMPNLRGQMASIRVSNPGGGGHYNPTTGNGEAWHKHSEMGNTGYFRKRCIKAGKWVGWWTCVRNKDDT